MHENTKDDASKQLTQYLITDPPNAYGRREKSPILTRVERAIDEMADEIAKEVIAENPKLREVITARTKVIVEKSLREDEYLNSVIAVAVGKALAQLIDEREPR